MQTTVSANSMFDSDSPMHSKRLIQTINNVQEALRFLNSGNNKQVTQLDLPRIAVVGGQSAGKSSVLESIVGFDFLPRGSGIVTRRPLIIELVATKPGERVVATLRRDPSTGERERVFTHDITKVRDAIVAATQGHPECQNNGVSDQPIALEIRSPDVLNLTLVDLPGMVVYARQSDEIKERIEKMVRSFVDNENTIILAVTPANADLANSDAIRVATEVDPEGKRTIGVLTKVDIVDKGTEEDVMNIILKRKDADIPFHWYPVKNRSQADINENKTVCQQRLEEEEFFDSWFRGLGTDTKCGAGITYLSNVLHSALVHQIKNGLLQIESDVKGIYEIKRREFDAFKHTDDASMLKQKAYECIQAYCDKLVKQLHGRDRDLPFDSLSVGAKIVNIYKGRFVQEIEAVDPLADLDDETLLNLIKNTRAHDDGSFLPHEALKRVVEKNIKVVLPICLTCVDDVFDELSGQARRIHIENDSERLLDWIRETAVENMNAWKDESKSVVGGLVRMEKRINPDHPDYYSEAEVKKMLADRMAHNHQQTTEKENRIFLPNGTFQLRVGTSFTHSKESEYTFRESDGSLVDTRNEAKAIELRNLCQKNLVKFSNLSDKNLQFLSDDQDNRGPQWTLLFHVSHSDSGRTGTSPISCWCFSALRQSILHQLKCSALKVTPATDVSTNAVTMPPTVLGEVDMIRALLNKYFDKVIRVKIIDSVPKAIALYFIDAVEESLWRKLNRAFLDVAEGAEQLKELMGLSEEAQIRRKNCQEAVYNLGKAMDAVKELRGLNPSSNFAPSA